MVINRLRCMRATISVFQPCQMILGCCELLLIAITNYSASIRNLYLEHNFIPKGVANPEETFWRTFLIYIRIAKCKFYIEILVSIMIFIYYLVYLRCV